MAEWAHRRPNKHMFEGQTPPALEMFEQDNLDWYSEMMRRAREGYSYRGDSFTGDQWWYYNFCPITGYLLDANKKPTDQFDLIWPYWCQEDDYIHKQIWEAKQAGMASGLMTGRGFGKTYIVVAIGNSIFYLKKKSIGYITASIELHADATWRKFQESIRGVNEKHPTIALSLLKEGTSDDEIISGDRIDVNGKMTGVPYSLMKKIVYGNNPGKSKGDRIDFQHLEEFGDWSGAATLKECIAASEGTWKVGSVNRARVFYTGTGGTVKSAQAKDIAFNPQAYNIYPVRMWGDRPTIMIMPAWRKRGGFWEETGFTDQAASQADLNRIREEKKLDPDPTIYQKFIQEYPDNPQEMFAQAGTNRFPVAKLMDRLAEYDLYPDKKKGEWGMLEWEKDSMGEITGCYWVPDNNGKMWMLEPPKINPTTGRPYRGLYTGGYDGIDLGTEQSTSGNSRGSLCVKKRLYSTSESNNLYVFFYVDRPPDQEEFFDNCHKVMYFFNLWQAVNIEFSKIAILSHLTAKKATHYLMPRPRITLENVDTDKSSGKIGTTAHEKNFQYGENFLIVHLRDYGDQFHYIPGMQDLIDFRMENRGDHDITVSMMMCELGDNEMMDRKIEREVKPIVKTRPVGFYTVKVNGVLIKKYGELPDSVAMRFQQQESTPDFIDRQRRPGK